MLFCRQFGLASASSMGAAEAADFVLRGRVARDYYQRQPPYELRGLPGALAHSSLPASRREVMPDDFCPRPHHAGVSPPQGFEAEAFDGLTTPRPASDSCLFCDFAAPRECQARRDFAFTPRA